MLGLRLSCLVSKPFKFTFERSLFTSLNDLGRNRRQYEGGKKREKRISSRPPSPAESKILKVSILGTTNSGKSTLINKLMGHLVCPESMKPNTTRTNARAILTQDEKQVVFLDTPGVLDTAFVLKCNIENAILLDPEKSCQDADLLLILHDVSNRYVREAINMKILRLLTLYYFKCPSILVLNKMDTIPKSRRVYDLIRKLTCNRLDGVEGEVNISKESKRSVEKYLERKARSSEGKRGGEGATDFSQILWEARQGSLTEDDVSRLTAGLVGWPGFKEVFAISALHGDGVPDLKEYLLGSAKPGKWRYPEGLEYDGDTKQIVLNIIKSKFLDHLPNVIPYKLVPEIQMWEMDERWNRLQIVVTVDCHQKNIFQVVIGKKGSKISKISEDIQQCLTNFFSQEVFFKLNIVPKFTFSLENQNEKKPLKPTSTLNL